LIILSRTQADFISLFRARALDVLTPLLETVSQPATIIERINASFHDFVALRADNQKLRDENTHMMEWQNAVIALEKENKELRSLLNFKTEPRTSFVSARAIADVGGAYSHGLIITAGKEDGVREGMAAVTGEGLIGRVIEAGDWSSRIWLISDMNSRIPVTIAETGDRAILAGDNTAQPKLLFLARDASVPAGAHIVTSGHGGVFPPNLPIGILEEKGRGMFAVVPTADLGKITYVRLVDFNLEGGAFNPLGTRAHTESKKK